MCIEMSIALSQAGLRDVIYFPRFKILYGSNYCLVTVLNDGQVKMGTLHALIRKNNNKTKRQILDNPA